MFVHEMVENLELLEGLKKKQKLQAFRGVVTYTKEKFNKCRKCMIIDNNTRKENSEKIGDDSHATFF